jgi:hypothetical protein
MKKNGEVPTLTIRDRETQLLDVLRFGQRLLFKYPVAARALYRAFVAEGRRFAETAEGRRWRKRLEGSQLIERGAVVWEIATLNLLDEDGDHLLPSALVDALAQAATVAELEPMLSRLFEGAQ